MKIMKVKINKRIYAFFEYILALVLILNCRSVWMNMLHVRDWFGNGLLLLLITSTTICIFFRGKCTLNVLNKAIFSVIIIAIYLIVFLVLNFCNGLAFLKLMVSVIFLLLYFYICTERDNIPSLFFKYSDLIFVIACVSIVFWVVGSLLEIIPVTETVYINWSNLGNDIPIKSYYGVYFNTQGQLSILNIFSSVRNTAIFTEAPMCAFHFCLSLLVQLFLKNEVDKKKVIVLSVGIISTLSTLGYVLLLAALAAKYILEKPGQKMGQYIKIMIIPSICIVVLLLANHLIINRLGSGSGSIRIDDFIVGFRAWMTKPILGAGYGNQEYIKRFMQSWRVYNTGFSNSLMQLLAQMGIYGGLLYFLPLFCKVKKCVMRKNWKQLVFVGLSFYLITFIIVTYNYITIAFMVWCFVSSSRKVFINKRFRM